MIHKAPGGGEFGEFSIGDKQMSQVMYFVERVSCDMLQNCHHCYVKHGEQMASSRRKKKSTKKISANLMS